MGAMSAIFANCRQARRRVHCPDKAPDNEPQKR